MTDEPRDLDEVKRRLDLLPDDPGHAYSLMADTAEKADLLTTLHEDLLALKAASLQFTRRILLVVSLLTVISIVALGLGIVLLGDVQDAQDSANGATAANTLLSINNADLITRLDRVAKDAQENGAAASKQQCREIEKLKRAIRGIIRSSPNGRSVAADSAVARFPARDCSRLPNARPVQP